MMVVSPSLPTVDLLKGPDSIKGPASILRRVLVLTLAKEGTEGRLAKEGANAIAIAIVGGTAVTRSQPRRVSKVVLLPRSSANSSSNQRFRRSSLPSTSYIIVESIRHGPRHSCNLVAKLHLDEMTDNLFRYAKAVNPDRDLPSDVKLVHNQHTMTIFDLYPKGELQR
jgi:hypothetical protein